jgi:hypothetical protein
VVKRNVAVTFSAEVVKTLARALPQPQSGARRTLLPRILQEWSRTDLQNHLSRDTRAVVHGRIKRSNNVARSAGRFLDALRAVERRDLLVSQIVIAEGRSMDKVSREEVADLSQQLDDVQGLLAKIAAISPEQIWKLRRGQPRNFGAHLVLRDAAAIFEWYSGMKAARRVDRIGSNETGPFFRFASALWPVIFGQSTAGLPAAMKTWNHWRVRGERSPVMANMALRHPTWRIFDSW